MRPAPLSQLMVTGWPAVTLPPSLVHTVSLSGSFVLSVLVQPNCT